MITRIELIHERRNFFGYVESTTEAREYNIERKHVLKALKYLLTNGHDRPYVHVDIDGGTRAGGLHHVLYQERVQLGTNEVTWLTYSDPHGTGNVATDKRTVAYEDVRRESRKW